VFAEAAFGILMQCGKIDVEGCLKQNQTYYIERSVVCTCTSIIILAVQCKGYSLFYKKWPPALAKSLNALSAISEKNNDVVMFQCLR